MSFCLYYGGRLVFTVSHTAVTIFLLAVCLLSLAALFATATTSSGPIHLDDEDAEELEIAEHCEHSLRTGGLFLDFLPISDAATRTSMSSPVKAVLKVRSPPRSPTSDQTTFPPLDPGTMV